MVSRDRRVRLVRLVGGGAEVRVPGWAVRSEGPEWLYAQLEILNLAPEDLGEPVLIDDRWIIPVARTT